MMRAAPMTPLRIETSTTRAGKNIDYVDIAMLADDELCVRASALRIRTADVVIDEVTDPTPIPQPPTPDAAVVSHFRHPEAERPAFHHAIDVSVDADAAVAWFRLAVPIVDDEPTSGFVAVATVADWTYSIPNMIDAARGGGTLPTERTVFSINADTTVSVHRPLSGRWVGLRSLAYLGPLGAGTSAAQLFDDGGPLGFTSQSLLLRGASGAPLSVRAGRT